MNIFHSLALASALLTGPKVAPNGPHSSGPSVIPASSIPLAQGGIQIYGINGITRMDVDSNNMALVNPGALTHNSDSVLAYQNGTWSMNQTQVGGAAVTLGSKTSANSYPVVIASDQAAIPVTVSAGTNLIGQVYAGVQIGTAYNGTTLVSIFKKAATVSSSGATTIVAAVGGQSVHVLSCLIVLNSSTSNSVNLQSHTTTSNRSAIITSATTGTGFCEQWNPMGWMTTTTGEALDINLSASQSVDYEIVYAQY